eukprot:COSAG04_NODE_3059_length_3223_cov_4.698464_2_plen_185_part_00
MAIEAMNGATHRRASRGQRALRRQPRRVRKQRCVMLQRWRGRLVRPRRPRVVLGPGRTNSRSADGFQTTLFRSELGPKTRRGRGGSGRTNGRSAFRSLPNQSQRSRQGGQATGASLFQTEASVQDKEVWRDHLGPAEPELDHETLGAFEGWVAARRAVEDIWRQRRNACERRCRRGLRTDPNIG